MVWIEVAANVFALRKLDLFKFQLEVKKRGGITITTKTNGQKVLTTAKKVAAKKPKVQSPAAKMTQGLSPSLGLQNL